MLLGSPSRIAKPQDLAVIWAALHALRGSDNNKLSFTERMVLKAVRAHEGDYRDWEAIDAWAESIAQDLG